jgi:acyl carrier protein
MLAILIERGYHVATPEEIVRTHIAQNILFSKTYPHLDEASFLEEGIIDSMNVMELILFVEEKFGVEVIDDEIVPDNFDSVARIARFVRQKSAVAA